MGHEIPTQPLGRAASGEIVAKINGKHLQCNGTECPWMTTDTEQRTEDMKKLGRAVSFCVAFMVFEVVGGIQAGSLAILTDAAHLLSDVASFAISLFAMWAGGWEANLRQSYGFFRLEILGALVSIQIIWLITGIIVYEAFVRLVNEPVEIDGRLMFIIATLGLLVNLVMMFLLGHGHDHGHSHGSSNEHSHGHGHGHSHGSSNEHSRGHDHGHSHGSSNEHSPGHDHGHSHRSNNRITIEHKHTKQHNQLQSNHDHDEDPLRQPLLAEGHSDSHHHGKEHSHDHHENAEQSPESPAQGKDFHHHHEDDQGHDDLNLRHQDRGDKVHRESDGIPGMVTYTGHGMDQSAGTVLEGHKTECVQENITKRSRSNDTIIVCICDQLENRSENDSSVRVIIDHGRDHGEQDGISHGSSINVRGAYLHVLGDLIQSIGVMVGGAIIWYKPEWKIVDLFCTFFFSIIVLGTTIKMIRDILEVLMESTPREVDAEALQSGLLAIEGVLEVHELHIWAITVGKVVLACHVMIKPDADSDDLLEKVIQYCDHKYKISHVTIQIERQKE